MNGSPPADCRERQHSRQIRERRDRYDLIVYQLTERTTAGELRDPRTSAGRQALAWIKENLVVDTWGVSVDRMGSG
jgi:hypothetical protein